MSQNQASHVQELYSQVLQYTTCGESEDAAAEVYSTEHTPLLEENKNGKSSHRSKNNYFKGSWMDMFTLGWIARKYKQPKPIDKDHQIALLQATITQLDITRHKAIQQAEATVTQLNITNHEAIRQAEATIQQLNATHHKAIQQAEERLGHQTDALEKTRTKLQKQVEDNHNIQQTNALLRQRLAAVTETNKGLVNTNHVLRELVQSERSARQDNAKYAEKYEGLWHEAVKEHKEARKEPAPQTLTLSKIMTTINYDS